MWSSMLSCCNDCLLGVQPDPHGKQLVSQKAAVGRGSYATAATDNRRSVSWVDEGHQRDEEDEDEHLRSKLVLKNRRSSSTVSKKNNEDPFKNVGRNKVKRQSVQSRADSSSDTDTSSVLPTPKSSMGSLNTADGGTSRGQGHRKPLRDDRDAPGASTPPAARTIAVAQQPRREEIFRPDLVRAKPSTAASPSSQLKQSLRLKTEAQLFSSTSSSLNSSRSGRKATPAHFLSPEEAACVAVDNRPPSSGSPQQGNTPPVTNSIFQWLSNSQNEKRSPTIDEIQLADGVTKRGSLDRLRDFVVGDPAASQASYQYEATSGGGARAKVNLRSKNTVQSIGAKKASLQSNVIAQYTFGFIHIAYKFSKEKKLEVDVLKVTKLPKYEASFFGDENDNESKVQSLKYVDIEVCLRLSKGKELTYKIKKFRTGDDDTDDVPFEPECSFRHKNLEDCVLVLSVSRRQKNLVVPTQCVGHALLKLTRQNVQTPGVVNKILPLKHGIQEQNVKGSMLLVLTCKHPVARMVKLSLEVRLVQYLDVSMLGISLDMVGSKVNPEIKIKTQLIGSEKSGSSRAKESSWIGLQNNTPLARKQDEGAGDFGGWGTLFSEKCSTSRSVLDSELKAMTLSFIVQVYGRNNVGPAAKKEVLLGTVVLGPEMRCSPEYPSSVENGSLTQWGEAVTKRKEVEQLHRLHL